MGPPPSEPVVSVDRSIKVVRDGMAQVTTVSVVGADQESVHAALDDTLAKLTEAGDPLYLPILAASTRMEP